MYWLSTRISWGVTINDKKPSNTAAFSQLGNLYQYLVALECCLELPEGQLVNIEQLGDITHADFQYEIKHHKDPNHFLGDTHIDFWKTLRNWVDNRKILSSYGNLVLLTSSIVKDDSLMGEWNRLDPQERSEQLVALRNQIQNSDKEYKTIGKHVQRVFDFSGDYEEKHLVEVISKITIKPSSDSAIALWESLKDHQALLAIPKNKRTELLTSLLGFIARKGVTSTSKWDIEISEFHEWLREQADAIRNRDFVSYPDLDSIEIGAQYEDHRFIKEIVKIPYIDKIPGAARDYYFTTIAIGRMADQNPHVMRGFDSEVNQIGVELIAKKENICLSTLNKNTNNLVKLSKSLYNDALISLKAAGRYTKSVPKEFHRGLIHTHVDGSDFEWRIEESDIED